MQIQQAQQQRVMKVRWTRKIEKEITSAIRDRGYEPGDIHERFALWCGPKWLARNEVIESIVAMEIEEAETLASLS